jgi:hypothetical protein
MCKNSEKDSIADIRSDTKSEGSIFSEAHLISFAKGYSTGPAMTLKSSLRLPWNSNVFSSPDLRIDHPSLGLRDGVLLVVRGKDDWQRACRQEKEVISAQSVNGVVEDSTVLNIAPSSFNAKALPPWKMKSKPAIKKFGEGALIGVKRSMQKSSSVNSILTETGGSGNGKIIDNEHISNLNPCSCDELKEEREAVVKHVATVVEELGMEGNIAPPLPQPSPGKSILNGFADTKNIPENVPESFSNDYHSNGEIRNNLSIVPKNDNSYTNDEENNSSLEGEGSENEKVMPIVPVRVVRALRKEKLSL